MVWTFPVRQFRERRKMASAARPVASRFSEALAGEAAGQPGMASPERRR